MFRGLTSQALITSKDLSDGFHCSSVWRSISWAVECAQNSFNHINARVHKALLIIIISAIMLKYFYRYFMLNSNYQTVVNCHEISLFGHLGE